MVVNLESGAQQVVPDTSDVSIRLPTEGGEFHLGAIGSQWVEAVGRELSFINLHTGKIIGQSESEPSNEVLDDLNEAGLLKPLCAPLTLEASEITEAGEPAHGEKYLPVEYDPPFAVISANNAGYGYLRRCGSSKRLLLLGHCGGGGSGQTIGGGVLACGEDFVTQLSSLRLYPWYGVVYRLKRLVPEREFENIEHTATTVFASVSHEPSRVYYARLPWAKIHSQGGSAR